MHRFIITSLSLTLVIATTAPAFARSKMTQSQSLPFAASNPPAEVPSPILQNLDPTSARQPDGPAVRPVLPNPPAGLSSFPAIQMLRPAASVDKLNSGLQVAERGDRNYHPLT
jgi:hypothetical protein